MLAPNFINFSTFFKKYLRILGFSNLFINDQNDIRVIDAYERSVKSNVVTTFACHVCSVI